MGGGSLVSTQDLCLHMTSVPAILYDYVKLKFSHYESGMILHGGLKVLDVCTCITLLHCFCL